MNDRHRTKRAYQEEIGHRLPSEAFPHTGIDGCLRRGGRFESVIHRVGMSVHRPQRVGHIHQVLIGTIYRERQVRTTPPVVVPREHLSHFNKTALKIIPRRVVKVINPLHTLFVVLIKIGLVVIIFRGAI